VSNNISQYTVPWVAAESRYGFELAMEWIDAKEEHIAAAGWNTLAGLAALKADDELDIPAYKKLLARVEKTIHKSQNLVRNTMNGFVIAVGTYIAPLTKDAIAAANKIGVVTVDMNGTACKVPDAVEYINKTIAKNGAGKKKKTVKC